MLNSVTNHTVAVSSVHQLLESAAVKTDTYLSYLPLPFMLEFALVNAFLPLGTAVGFGASSISYLPLQQTASLLLQRHSIFAPSLLSGIPRIDMLSKNCSLTPKAQDRPWRIMSRKKFLVEKAREWCLVRQ
jgi:long-subunit acyl-CoA synthetase (AMP-forming)